MINMTIIVTVKTDEKIIIGADKRIIEEDIIVSEDSSKMLIKELTTESYQKITEEQFIIAFTGAYSLFELLKTFTAPVKESRDTFLEYLYKTFVPKLNSHLNKYNFIQDYNGQNGVNWELLIAYKNNLFLVEFNLGICEITSSYYATGSPRNIALGSLYTSNLKSNPVEIFMVKTAIQACAAHSTSCNDKMEIYSIHKTGDIKKIT